MIPRIVAASVFSLLCAVPPGLRAADDTKPPSSLRTARRFEAKKDYVSALLAYGSLLERNPRDRRTLKRMIRCHEKLLDDELRDSLAATKQQAAAEEIDLPNLPEIVPGEPKNWPAVHSKPKGV